jgi:hypothetical protein
MPLATTAAPRPVAKPVVKTPLFLASACSFQRPTTAATTLSILKHTPQEGLADELTRYFNFDAAPIERQEGEEGSDSDEPSVQEVLLNPLLWWKVRTLFICCVQPLIIHFQKHASEFPIIAQMARDILAIPATSVSVEQVFSKSRHICTQLFK